MVKQRQLSRKCMREIARQHTGPVVVPPVLEGIAETAIFSPGDERFFRCRGCGVSANVDRRAEHANCHLSDKNNSNETVGEEETFHLQCCDLCEFFTLVNDSPEERRRHVVDRHLTELCRAVQAYDRFGKKRKFKVKQLEEMQTEMATQTIRAILDVETPSVSLKTVRKAVTMGDDMLPFRLYRTSFKRAVELYMSEVIAISEHPKTGQINLRLLGLMDCSNKSWTPPSSAVNNQNQMNYPSTFAPSVAMDMAQCSTNGYLGFLPPPSWPTFPPYYNMQMQAAGSNFLPLPAPAFLPPPMMFNYQLPWMVPTVSFNRRPPLLPPPTSSGSCYGGQYCSNEMAFDKPGTSNGGGIQTTEKERVLLYRDSLKIMKILELAGEEGLSEPAFERMARVFLSQEVLQLFRGKTALTWQMVFTENLRPFVHYRILADDDPRHWIVTLRQHHQSSTSSESVDEEEEDKTDEDVACASSSLSAVRRRPCVDLPAITNPLARLLYWLISDNGAMTDREIMPILTDEFGISCKLNDIGETLIRHLSRFKCDTDVEKDIILVKLKRNTHEKR